MLLIKQANCLAVILSFTLHQVRLTRRLLIKWLLLREREREGERDRERGILYGIKNVLQDQEYIKYQEYITASRIHDIIKNTLHH